MSNQTNPANQAKYNHLYPKGRKATALAAGAQAPDFTLKTTPDQAVSLSDLAKLVGGPAF